MSISYNKKFVDKVLRIEKDEQVFDGETIKRRFLLEIKLKNKENENSVAVIMMNPSEADEEKSDRTINKVVKYVFNNDKTKGYGRILIMNLFVAYKTKPEGVNKLIAKSDFDYVVGNKDSIISNNEYILNATKESELTIIAWGKGSITRYRERSNAVLKLLPYDKLHCVKSLTKEGYPRHPRNWSHGWELITYDQALKNF